jgi:hypothetical protein
LVLMSELLCTLLGTLLLMLQRLRLRRLLPLSPMMLILLLQLLLIVLLLQVLLPMGSCVEGVGQEPMLGLIVGLHGKRVTEAAVLRQPTLLPLTGRLLPLLCVRWWW